MRIEEVSLFYLLAALVVGLTLHRQGRPNWLGLFAWPLLLPGMLTAPEARFDTVYRSDSSDPTQRLQEALTLLHVGTDLAPLKRGVSDLARRCEGLTVLLAQDTLRPENRAALMELQGRLRREQQATLDRIEDLVTAIHLAHYGGRSLGQIEDQLADLMAMVEGITEVQDLACAIPRHA